MKQSSVKLLDAVLVPVTGESHAPVDAKRTFQATGFTTAGAGSVTIVIEASNDNVNFLTLATITLVLGVAVTTDGTASDAAWRYVRARVTAISGTGAQTTVWLGA